MDQVDTTGTRKAASERINAWYAEHCTPAVQAIYVKDGPLAESLLADAYTDLAASGLAQDERNALHYRICYLQWQMERVCQDQNQEAAHARRACDDLERPANGPVAEIVRNQVLLQMRTTCLRDSILPYPAEEFETHFKAVEQEFRTLEFWHYVSNWAFLNRRQDYLGQALEVHTIHADGFMSDFLWQRINIMLLLLKGAAQKVDVIELVKRINNSFQLHNVEKIIWPACQEAGLIDADIEQRLTAQLGKFSSEPLKPPQREKATKALLYR